MQVLQFLSWVDAEFVPQRLLDVMICPYGIRAAPRHGQCCHEVLAGLFVERLLGGHLSQDADGLVISARGDECLPQCAARRPEQLAKPRDFHRGPARIFDRIVRVHHS